MFEDLELGEILLILIALGVIGYFIWDFLNNPNNSPEDNSSLINKADAAIFGPSPEGYTQALSTTLSSPIATLKSIFGID